MWRNMKYPSLCVQFMVFCCILHCFVAKFVFFCDLRCFVAKMVCRDLLAIVWRKFCSNSTDFEWWFRVENGVMIEMNPAMVIPSKMDIPLWCYKWDWGYLTVLITSRQAIWDADWGGVEWMVEKMDVSTGLLQMGGCSWSWGLRDDLSPPLPLKLNINTGEPTTDRNVNYCTLVLGGNNTCNRMWLCISSGRYFKGRVSQLVCLSFVPLGLMLVGKSSKQLVRT